MSKEKQKQVPTLFSQIYEHFGFSPGGGFGVDADGKSFYKLPSKWIDNPQALALAEDFIKRTDLTGVDYAVFDETPVV